MAIDYKLKIASEKIIEEDLKAFCSYSTQDIQVFYKSYSTKTDIFNGSELVLSFEGDVFEQNYEQLANFLTYFVYNPDTKYYFTIAGYDNVKGDINEPIFTNIALTEISYLDFNTVKESFGLVNCSYFGKFIFQEVDEKFIFLVKRNNNLCFVVYKNATQFKDYSGTILNNIAPKDVYGFYENSKYYFVFKVNNNLYVYDYNDNFSDENLILFLTLPEDLNNLIFSTDLDSETFIINHFYLVNDGFYYIAKKDTSKYLNIKLSTSEEIFDTIKIDTESVITKFEVNTITNNFSLRFYNNDNLVFETKLNKPVSQIEYVDKLIYDNVEYEANTSNWEKTTIPLSNNLPQESILTIHIGDKIRYLIQFINEDVTPRTLLERQRVYANNTPIYTQQTPVKEGYTFIGWTPNLYPANKNQDYIATFELTPIDYNLTFKDSNNESFTPTTFTFKNYITRILFNNDLFGNPYIYIQDLEGEKTINFSYTNKGLTTRIKVASITINGSTYNQLNTYFDVNIEENTEITLNSEVEYYIEFRDYNQMPLQTKWVKANTTPTYTGLTPSRTGYNFIGWTPTLYLANKTQIYIATYEIIKYTIRFLNEDKSVLETKEVNYGETPTYTGTTPTKEGYTFIGRTPNLYPATQNQDYVAVFRNNAFAINLYKNTAENNRVDKNSYLTSVGEIEGYLRDETSIINPTIVIEYNKVIDFNYIYISTFNRYYFVNEVQSVRTNLWRLSLSCDVLMTYKDTILNYECFVNRNENDFNNYIEDNYLPLQHQKEIEYQNITDTGTGGQYNFFQGWTLVFTSIATSSELPLDLDKDFVTPFKDYEGNESSVSSYECGSSNFKVVQFMSTASTTYQEDLRTITSKMLEDDNIVSYFISCIVFPVSNPVIYGADPNNYQSVNGLYYKDTKIELGDNRVTVLKTDVIPPVRVGSAVIPAKFSSYLDYEPYASYEIWLPFHGWEKLPSLLVVGKTIEVFYVLNSDSTKASIIIKNSDDKVVFQGECVIGVEIALNTSNNQEIQNRKISSGIQTAGQVIGGALLMGVGAVTGNPLALMGGGSMILGGVFNNLAQQQQLRAEGNGKISDGNAGLFSDRNVVVKKSYSKIAVDDITKYAKYVGRPLQEAKTLNDLFGFTIVGGVHVENLPTATESEKQEIERLLKKGIILKNKTN